MADRYDGIEAMFDRSGGITLVETVSMGCPGNLIDLVCRLASQPDTPIPSLTDAMAAVLFSFQFPEKILIDIIGDFETGANWKDGDPESELRFHGSDMLALYFDKRHIEEALAITRARAAVGIDGWKDHHFADEWDEVISRS